jgi:hypothetical protein
LSTPLEGFNSATCAAEPFHPVFTSATSANTSRQNGASLTVRYTQRAGEANIRKVETQLPVALPSRLTTLQKACTESQFASDPNGCPVASRVGTVAARSPLLPAPLTGTAILVSHGGREFPDLDFLLQSGEIKVRVNGHTEIKNGITYSRFETVPDAPVESFEVNLPEGPNSLLAANGSFCSEAFATKTRVPLRHNGHVVRKHGQIVYRTETVNHEAPANLVMPTTIIGQNGAKLTQNTKIAVEGCASSAPAVKVDKVRVSGNALLLTLTTSAKGTVTVTGKGLKRLHRTLAAGPHTLRIVLTKAGRTLKRHHRTITVKVALNAGGKTTTKKPQVKL